MLVFYAEQDARLTLMLWQRFKQEIQQQSLTTIWELESELLPILIKMRQRGVRVQVESAEKLKQEMIRQEKEVLLAIKKESGLDIDIWAARQISTAFDKLKIEYPRTPKKLASPHLHTIGWLIVNIKSQNLYYKLEN